MEETDGGNVGTNVGSSDGDARMKKKERSGWMDGWMISMEYALIKYEMNMCTMYDYYIIAGFPSTKEY